MIPAAGSSFLDAGALRRPIRNAILGSLVLNLLALTTPLYMLAIYDRVMTSRSGATLLAVTVATVLLLVLLAIFDFFRNIVFARTSATFYAELEARVYQGCRRWALAGGSVRRVRPLEDLETAAKAAFTKLNHAERDDDDAIEASVVRAVRKAAERLWKKRPLVDVSILRI